MRYLPISESNPHNIVLDLLFRREWGKIAAFCKKHMVEVGNGNDSCWLMFLAAHGDVCEQRFGHWIPGWGNESERWEKWKQIIRWSNWWPCEDEEDEAPENIVPHALRRAWMPNAEKRWEVPKESPYFKSRWNYRFLEEFDEFFRGV